MRGLGLVIILCCHVTAHAQMAEPHSLAGQVTTGVSPSQDTAFAHALLLKITARQRFAEQSRQTTAILETSTAFAPALSIWERAMVNLAMITPEMMAPTAQEVVAHQTNLRAATYVPGVLLYPMGSGNLQVGLGSIGRFIGIVEDVSPKLTYALIEASEVKVTVYSASALQVRLLYKGIQQAGRYSMEWDGRDDLGREAVRGDYIAEITIGQDHIIRKRIVWPPEQ